jgi:hypothetical protein
MELLNILTNNNTENDNSFLISNFGSAISNGIDAGLKYLLPDFIEDDIIDIKNSLISGGLTEGINTAIDSVIDLGKSALGIFTGNFENISQVEKVVEDGGLLDTISGVLDKVITSANNSGLINDTISSLLKNGKDILLGNVSDKLSNSIEEQIESVEKLDEYSSNWKEYYNAQDFDGMEKEYEKIKEELENLAPLEDTINKARTIENLQTLIKNNGGNFNLSEEVLALAENI